MFLESLSALDPIVRGHSAAVTAMNKLRAFFSTLNADQDSYEAEVKKYHLTENLPSPTNVSLDHWWAKVMPTYPALLPIIKACLGIFTGPRVEQSFSMMNHIITTKSNRMAVSTYEVYQAIKYL